jgi:hypothetical protein
MSPGRTNSASQRGSSSEPASLKTHFAFEPCGSSRIKIRSQIPGVVSTLASAEIVVTAPTLASAGMAAKCAENESEQVLWTLLTRSRFRNNGLPQPASNGINSTDNRRSTGCSGLAAESSRKAYEDLGIELALSSGKADWTCRLRSDLARRYHRFSYLRHLREQRELILLVEALSGLPWSPENHLYGAMRTPEEAVRIRSEDRRFDRILLQSSQPHYEIEKDKTGGGALPEHQEALEGGSL